MCHPHFKEFLRAAKKYDFYVNILSNLTLLDDETIAIMKEGNVSSVQVSLYSMIPEHHDAITTVKGSFEKTRDAILKLIENDLPVHVSCPTMKGNKDDFGDVMKWCHEHKIRAQTDYIMMAEFNHETSNLANRLSVEEAGEVIKQISLGDKEYQKAILAQILWNDAMQTALIRNAVFAELEFPAAVWLLTEMFIHVPAGRKWFWEISKKIPYKTSGTIQRKSNGFVA